MDIIEQLRELSNLLERQGQETKVPRRRVFVKAVVNKSKKIACSLKMHKLQSRHEYHIGQEKELTEIEVLSFRSALLTAY